MFWQSAKKTRNEMVNDFPFLFCTVGHLMDLLLRNVYDSNNDENIVARSGIEKGSGEESQTANTNGDWDEYRKLLQSVFFLRELREEREPLSIEVQIPFSEPKQDSLNIKKLAQVFGRGIGTSRSESLTKIENPTGTIARVFSNHESAPQSLLYQLRAPFGHLKDPTQSTQPKLSIVLRRDGHVTIAAYENPLLEFYDGGWHTVDLQAGRYAVQELLGLHFGARCDPDLAEFTMNLAYHLATHWHGGLLAITDEFSKLEAKDGPLEPECDDSKALFNEVKDKLKTKENRASLIDVQGDGEGKEGTGMGRLFLSCAIQDGALIFDPSGELLSIGRIVRSREDQKSHSSNQAETRHREMIGSRRCAARTLGKYGISFAISHDGAIRLYCKYDEKGINIDGLRLH